jgi:transcriptional regulator NrdR family protein
VGQLTEMESVVVASPDSDPTVCLDDFFHVSASRMGEDDTPATAGSAECRLHEVKSHVKEAECPETEAERQSKEGESQFGIYMVENRVSEMTAFLTRVAHSRKVTGHNVESWVDAVENKLDDIGIASIQMTVASISIINPQLSQVGHVPMYTRTLDIMAREGVKMLRIAESLSASNADEMRAFLQTVAEARNITGNAIDSWVEKVQDKLRRIGLTTVKDTVSGIVRLNRQLREAGLTTMHFITVDCMARKGVEALLCEPLEVISSDDSGEIEGLDGIGTCTICNATGTVGESCAICEDEDGVYLNFHAGL